MSSDQQFGEYRGIKFMHESNDGTRGGIIYFPEDPQQHTADDSAQWEAQARSLIDQYIREIDVEPDDDSEA
jgi:hypothetical protein